MLFLLLREHIGFIFIIMNIKLTFFATIMSRLAFHRNGEYFIEEILETREPKRIKVDEEAYLQTILRKRNLYTLRSYMYIYSMCYICLVSYLLMHLFVTFC